MADARKARNVAELRDHRGREQSTGLLSDDDHRLWRNTHWYNQHYRDGWPVLKIAWASGVHYATIYRAIRRVEEINARLQASPESEGGKPAGEATVRPAAKRMVPPELLDPSSSRRHYRDAFWSFLHNHEGWSIERIAAREGVHRVTVARAVERHNSAADKAGTA